MMMMMMVMMMIMSMSTTMVMRMMIFLGGERTWYQPACMNGTCMKLGIVLVYYFGTQTHLAPTV